MQTIVRSAGDPLAVSEAAGYLVAGELVAIPTETVYGLGADGLNPEAVAKIFKAKGRPQDNPLILHIAEAKDMEKYCHSIPDAAYALAEKFWPGPLTMVLPAKDCVPKCTTAGLPTVAIRCPDCAVTRNIIRAAGVPVAAPSANTSGRPSPTTAEHVLEDLYGKVPYIIDGGQSDVGLESTIVLPDAVENAVTVLRPGGITPKDLAGVCDRVVLDKALTEQLKEGERPLAPGMKYRHYAPKAPVVGVRGENDAVCKFFEEKLSSGCGVLCFDEVRRGEAG